MATKARLLAAVRDFLCWWRRELAQLLPGGGGHGEGVVELEAWAEQGRTRVRLEGIEASPAEAPPEPLRRRLATADAAVLRLGAGLVLRHPVELPVAAEENLRQVLRFEMDRQTPFPPEAVYFDYALIARLPDQGRLRVDLAVAPRAAVDPLLAWLEGTGVAVRGMSPREAGDGLDLLPAERRRRRVDWVGWTRRGLAATAAVLLLVALALPIHQDRQRLARLEPAVAEARADAMAAQRLREEIERLSAATAFAGRQKREGTAALEVLAEITTRLSDDNWLQEFELQSGEVRLRGEGPNAAQLIDVLDGSSYFTNPRFRAPVTQGTSAEQERFYLSAEVTP